MIDREKVIKGLECRLDINGSKYKHCLNCDYRHDIDHCQWACQTDGILEDALALLKAQETEAADAPKPDSDIGCWYDITHNYTLEQVVSALKAQNPQVMTLSGVRNLKENTTVWLEDVDKTDVIGALFMRDYSGTKCVDFAIVRDWAYERITADYMDYGIRWRVWTSRPTREQMGAVKWE